MQMIKKKKGFNSAKISLPEIDIHNLQEAQRNQKNIKKT